MINRVNLFNNYSPHFNSNLLLQNRNLINRQFQMFQRIAPNTIYGNINPFPTRLSIAQSTRASVNQMLDFNRNYETNFTNLKDTATNLSLSNDSSIFAQRKAEISAANSAEVNVESDATRRSYQFEVSALAEKHQQISTEFEQDSFDFEVGEYEFSIEQGEKNFDFTVELKETMSNLEVLTELAEEINQAELEVAAEVITEDEQAHLEITSLQEGSPGEFSFVGHNENNLLEELDLEISQQAVDAEVKIDGLSQSEYTLTENRVLLDQDRLEVTLLAVDNFRVDVKSDRDKITAGIEDFVAEYNNLIDFTSFSRDNQNLVQLREDFIGLAREQSRQLRSLGINFSFRDAKLEINHSRLARTLTNRIDSLEDKLGGRLGFASRVEQRAENTLNRPATDFFNFSTLFYPRQSLTHFNSFNLYNNYGMWGAMQPGSIFDFLI